MSTRRGKFRKSPCGCKVDGSWRIVVGGVEPPLDNGLWGRLLRNGPNDDTLGTPAWDAKLKLWWLPEEYVLPDSDRDALICVECDEPTDGSVGFGDGLDEVSIHREQAGLDPEWHFAWMK
jgi:hypothetical protein